jgi:hypothetical protein
MTGRPTSIPFDGLEARLAAWLEAEARGEFPEELLTATLEVTRGERQARSLASRIASLVFGAPSRRATSAGVCSRRLAAAAAVIVIALGAVVATSFRQAPWRDPAQPPAGAPAAQASDLFAVTLDADAIPDELAGILVFRKVYPTDREISYDEGFVPPNTFVRHVEEGELGIRPRSEVRIIRAGSSWSEAEVVAAGQDTLIGPGDTFVMQDIPWDEYGPQALGEMWTPGEDASVVGFAIRESSRCCAMTHTGMRSPWYHTLVQGVDALRGAPVTLRLSRWEVPPAAELPAPVETALALRAVDEGQISGTVEPAAPASANDAAILSFSQGATIDPAVTLSEGDRLRLTNPGPGRAVVYELTVEPAEPDDEDGSADTVAVVSATGPMRCARSGHSATLLASELVLASGGGCADLETYDPESGSFIAAGTMARIRGASATLLEDGTVLLAGGSSGEAEIFDPATASPVAAGPALDERHFHSAVRMADGRVLVTGGETRTAEIYHPDSGLFTRAASMAAARARHASVLLRDGRVLVAGGGVPVLELYDPTTDRFDVSAAADVTPFDRGTATLLMDGRVLLIGHDAAPQIYDPETDSVVGIGPMTVPRYDHAAVVLNDGRVLVIGGMDAQRLQATASLELFDPRAGTFSEIGSLEVARFQPAAARLCDGSILVTGGSGGTAPLASAEIVEVRSLP